MNAWLYHSDLPEGRIFTSEEQYAEAVHDGWVDSPAKIGEQVKPIEVDIPVPEKPVKPRNGRRGKKK